MDLSGIDEFFQIIQNLVLFFVFGIVFIVIWGIISYILNGIGLMSLAKKVGEKNAALAWIPLLGNYLLGKIAFNKVVGYILAFLTILPTLFFKSLNTKDIFIQFQNPLFLIIFLPTFILYIICLYKLYIKFSKKAVIMIIFTVLSLGLLAPIFIFAIRKNNIIM